MIEVGTTALSPDRFQELADAYGGDIGRWPPSEQGAGWALEAAAPGTTDAILAEAAALDRLLASSTVPAPSLTLCEAVIASAPRRRVAVSARRWAGLGASLAAAGVAGILAGFAAAPIAASHVQMQAADTASEASRWLGEPADLSEG